MKRVTTALLLATLALPALGESFYLQLHRTGKMYGPYTYAEGAQVGEGQNVYELVEAGREFKLKSRKDGSTVGPFPFENGALVELAGVTFILIRQPSELKGTLSVSGFRPDRTEIHVLKVGPVFARDVAVLQRVFAVLHTKHERAIAPIQTAPRVYGTMPGFSRDGMAERSQKDVAKSRDSRDRQARRALDKFVPHHRLKTLRTDHLGKFGPRIAVPGDYVIYAVAKKRAGVGQGKLFEELFWWQPFTIQRGEAAEVSCARQNARTWAELFEALRTGTLAR